MLHCCGWMRWRFNAGSAAMGFGEMYACVSYGVEMEMYAALAFRKRVQRLPGRVQ